MPGYKDWIDTIDIKVDYFSAFMKAWIAFNAWYNNSGEVSGKSDKECIDFISSKSNRFKTYIENLLTFKSAEAISFRESLASLHSALLSAAITTQEYIGVRQTVSFSNVAMKNQNANESFVFRNVRYECSRAHGKIITVVTDKSGSEILKYEQDEYSLDNLQQQSTYKKLSLERQAKCTECYKKLKPYVSTSVLAKAEDSDDKDKYLAIGTFSFINDPDKVSSAIIIILYLLRCGLAHGDISPDESSNAVYRYAYEILCAPLRKLK